MAMLLGHHARPIALRDEMCRGCQFACNHRGLRSLAAFGQSRGCGTAPRDFPALRYREIGAYLVTYLSLSLRAGQAYPRFPRDMHTSANVWFPEGYRESGFAAHFHNRDKVDSKPISYRMEYTDRYCLPLKFLSIVH